MKGPKKMKKPSAVMVLPTNDEGLSLEEKMEKFHQKGGKSVDEFLSSLTQGQRECLWGRFSRARDALKDEKTTELWNQTCKGKGSDGPKKQLLQVFLETKGDLKKGNLLQKELIQLSQTVGGLDAKRQWAHMIFVCLCAFVCHLRQQGDPGVGPLSKHLDQIWIERSNAKSALESISTSSVPCCLLQL